MDGAPTQRDLAEELGRQLEVTGPGRFRLELTFENGRLQHWYRHEERIPAAVLQRPLRPAQRDPAAV